MGFEVAKCVLLQKQKFVPYPFTVVHDFLCLFLLSFILVGIDWEVKLPVPSNPDGADFHLRPCESRRLTEKFNKSIANLLVLRGVDVHQSDLTSFNDPRLHANWVPSSCGNTIWCHPRPFNHYEKSVTLLSNSQTPVAPLNSVVQKAWNMFTSRAYVHQYLKYGMTEDHFVDSFAATEQIIRNYSSL